MRKVKLKLASVKDKKPTILGSDLKMFCEKILITFHLDNEYFCASFHLSRNKKTYYADHWSFILPKIGKPLEVDLYSIQIIK